MNNSVLKYKKSYFFKNYPTFEEYLNEQLSIHVQDEDLEFLRTLIDTNQMTSDHAIMRMSKCPTSALPFYARYLFFDFKIEGINVLIVRFNQEQDEDKKVMIYNLIRPLVNHLELEEVLKTVDQGVLSILVGEYGRKKGILFENLGFLNVFYKFLGFFTIEEMKEIQNIDKFIENDINIMKIITLCTQDHFNLEKVLSNDLYLRFYLENCTINTNLLKKLPSKYNPYTLYLLLDKLKDDIQHCKLRINKLPLEVRTSVCLLFVKDEDWLNTFSLEELPTITLKNEDEILKIIKDYDSNDNNNSSNNNSNTNNNNLYDTNSFITSYYFPEVQELHKYIPKDFDLKAIDNILLEKCILKVLKKCSEEGMPLSIKKWMATKEIYFSIVIEHYPFLHSFHKSVLFNKKKRAQMAEEILKGSNKETFLMYLNTRNIYVDFQGIDEISYDFSLEWLKIFIEKNYNRTKIELHNVKNTKIIFKNEKNVDLAIKMMVNADKFNILNENIHKSNNSKKKNGDNTKRTKIDNTKIDKNKNGDNTKLMSSDEEYLIKLYKNNINTGINTGINKDTFNFRRLGILNKFISSHLHDLEGTARVTACVVRDVNHLEDLLRTIPFVIEEEKLLCSFIHHFLRFVNFTVPLALVGKWTSGVGPIQLVGKINLNDLDALVDKIYSEEQNSDLQNNVQIGFLLRGYSYLLPEHPTGGKFRKMKDGDITFYYSTNFNSGIFTSLEIKYRNESILYTCTNKEAYLSQMKIFNESKCPFRREIVTRCFKVVGFGNKQEEKDEDKQDDNHNIIQSFIKDPRSHLHLLHKLTNTPDKQTVFALINLLREVRGDTEDNILEILRSHPIDKEITIYILNYFECYSYSTKLRIISLLRGPVDVKVFIKYCEIIGNEDNLEVLRCLLEDLRDRKVYFPIIEKWKTNLKLTRLLLRIYPLGMKDKEFYKKILKNCNEEEENMIRKVWGKLSIEY